MGIQVKWDNTDNRVIILTVTGHWTWEDYYSSMASMHRMMEQSPLDVIDFVLDMRDGNTFPQNMMSQMQRQANHQHAKSGLMVVVGAAAFARVLFNMMERVVPARMRQVKMAESIDKARDLIRQYRADTIHTRSV